MAEIELWTEYGSSICEHSSPFYKVKIYLDAYEGTIYLIPTDDHPKFEPNNGRRKRPCILELQSNGTRKIEK